MRDDRLRLMFTCCHPALALPARVALTLRTLGGLTTAEIARAFLVPEPTMAQRLVRAKRKIADARHPLPRAARRGAARAAARRARRRLPDLQRGLRGDRAATGSSAASCARRRSGSGRLLAALMPDEPEVGGLLALMLLHDARRDARVDAAGGYVALDEQDRARWDRAPHRARASGRSSAALRLRRPGPYQVQAAIAALHAEAPSADDADWPQIAALYAPSRRSTPSPVVEVNRAVAIAFADGPRAALDAARAAARRPGVARLPAAARGARRAAAPRGRRGRRRARLRARHRR